MPVRLIRPGINSSDRVDALTAMAEVFYRRLLSVVDDYGRYDADWRVLRSSCFPLKADQISQEQLEGWLTECSAVQPGEEEPLIRTFTVRRKRYLEVTNFGQRIRTPSRFPEPGEAEGGEGLPASARNGAHLPAYARASPPPPNTNTNTHTPPTTPAREGGPGETRRRTGAVAGKPPPRRLSYARALATGVVTDLDDYRRKFA